MPTNAVRIIKTPTTFSDSGRWSFSEQRVSVEVLAIAQGYAMVRLPNCQPYVCSAECIEFDVPYKFEPQTSENSPAPPIPGGPGTPLDVGQLPFAPAPAQATLELETTPEPAQLDPQIVEVEP